LLFNKSPNITIRLKAPLFILAILLLANSLAAQYYLRGEVRDEKQNPLPNARILLHSTGYLYRSGNSGAFGIMITKESDSVTISLDGYQTLCAKVSAASYQQLMLKMLFPAANISKSRLVSFTRDLKPQDRSNWTVGGETYSSLLENEFITAKKFPVTGFAMHTDKASYSNIRRFLNMNTMVPPDAVRTEEVLNYFSYKYTAPPKDSVFGFHTVVSDCPWNPENKLLFLQMNAKKIDPWKVPPSNLVFLIDISGSMDMPNRLPLLKAGFKLMVENLREKDTISIVVYGSSISVWLPPTSGIEKDKIRKSIEDLTPGGPTPGESGIRMAYRLARSQFIKGGNNRVILATDGDFNVGQSTEEELDKLVTQHQQYGIYLTCLGVGMGNYKDSKLEVLAKKGNGNFAYLDNEFEAEKVLVKELTQTLYSVADDAFLDIDFNPDFVREYRLIGYDNKMKALADSLSEVDGGEVGSGHSVMAIFEIKPAIELKEYQALEKESLARIRVNYKNPGDSLNHITGYNCPLQYREFNDIDPSYRFATALTMFGSLLKDSKYSRRYNWYDIREIAEHAQNPSDGLQKEFLEIIEKAKKIYSHSRKKRRSEE